MRIRGVLFDKDGVLIDFDRTWGPACAEVIATMTAGDAGLAQTLADAIDFDLAARTFRPSSVFIAGTSAELLACWAKALGRRADASLAFEIIDLMTAAGLRAATAAPGLGETLDALDAARLPCGIATNDQEGSARAQMEKLGVAARFAFIAGADSGFGPKPGPGMIHAFADQLGIAPEQVAMVGDSLHDSRAARAAGALAIAIGTGPARLDTLAPHADHAIGMLAELPAILAATGPLPASRK